MPAPGKGEASNYENSINNWCNISGNNIGLNRKFTLEVGLTLCTDLSCALVHSKDTFVLKLTEHGLLNPKSYLKHEDKKLIY